MTAPCQSAEEVTVQSSHSTVSSALCLVLASGSVQCLAFGCSRSRPGPRLFVTHGVRNPEGLAGPFSRSPDGLNDWVAAAAAEQFASAQDARPRGACAGTGTWWMLRGQHVLRVSLHALCVLSVAARCCDRHPSTSQQRKKADMMNSKMKVISKIKLNNHKTIIIILTAVAAWHQSCDALLLCFCLSPRCVETQNQGPEHTTSQSESNCSMANE